MSETNLSRRAFLQATAIAGVTLASGASSLKPLTAEATVSDGETKVLRTCCKNCVHNCGVLAHVQNGRVVKLEGDPDNHVSKGGLCVKGLSGIQQLYNPNRIKYPMKRVGARGSNQWERISWTEAIDLIANEIYEGYKKYGPESLIISQGGGGHPVYGRCILRFLNVWGSPNWFQPGGNQCYNPREVVGKITYGGFPNDFVAEAFADEICTYDGVDTKCVVLWATNPAYAGAPMSERPVTEMRMRGTKVIVIDPRFTPDASKADVWLPIRPGADVALMLGWMRYIIDNELYDEDLLLKWSNMPGLVHPETKLCLRPVDLGLDGDNATDYVVWDKNSQSVKVLPYPFDDSLAPDLFGEYDVTLADGRTLKCKTGMQLLNERCEEWTLEKTAEVCWLDPSKIEEAVRMFAENTPGGISVGLAGEHTPMCMQYCIGGALIDFLVGNVGKPGAVMQQFPAAMLDPFFPYMPEMHHFLPKSQYVKRLGIIEHKGMLKAHMSTNQYCKEAMITGEPYKPRYWIDRSGNKLAMVANANSFFEVYDKMDLIVHMYMFPTSHSMYSDILLPATEWLEAMFTGDYANRAYVRQPCTHLWETLDEQMFFSLLAKRCAQLGHQGCIDSMDPAKCAPTQDDLPEGFLLSPFATGSYPWWDTLEEMLDNQFAKYGAPVNWQGFVDHCQEHGYYEFMTEEENRKYFVYSTPDPETGIPQGFGTPSKKLELYGERWVILGRTGAPYAAYELPPASKDYDPYPYWNDPVEASYDEEIAKKYPLLLTNGRVPWFQHGTLRNCPWVRERYPVPETLVNPVDATQYGLVTGDWVWLENDRGKTRGKIVVTEMIRPGVVYMERFWFPETLGTETQGWKEMNVNLLTRDSEPLNDIMSTYHLRAINVTMYKAEGAPEGIWTEPEQFEAWMPLQEIEVTVQSEVERSAQHD